MIETIEELQLSVSRWRLGRLITEIETTYALHGYGRLKERLEEVKADYELMRTFMISGGRDPQREYLYGKLRRKVYGILADARMAHIVKERPAFRHAAENTPDIHDIAGSIRETLEAFEGDLAMAELEGDKAESRRREVCRRQHEYRQTYFKSILVSSQIGTAEEEALTSVLLSQTTDRTDKVLMVSALLLALQAQYDDRKYGALLHAFTETDDEYLRSHLLVALMLSVHDGRIGIFKDTDNELLLVMSEENVKKELYELQIQMSLCNNVDEVNRTLKDDIIPTIMKHQKPTDILKDDTVEGSSLDEILKPNTSDESIDELEQSIGRMDEMQKNGLDIYFGGFAKMKHDIFFFTLVNWFYPFSVDHPQLSHINSNLLHSNLVDILIKGSSLCDSDMYSMVIGMQQVFNMLPQNFKDIFDRKEIKVREAADRCTAAYYRRTYLQNLLRFYRLYSAKQDFESPFAATDTEDELDVACKRWFFMNNRLFMNSGLFVEEELNLLKYLFKKGRYETCLKLANGVIENGTTSKQDTFVQLICGLANHELGYYNVACRELEMVLDNEPDNRVAQRYYVMAALALPDYASALGYAKRLAESNPENLMDRLHYVVALIGSGKAEEASKELFRMYYEHPDDRDVQETVAWAYLHTRKPERAAELYERLLEEDDSNLTVCVNAFYAFMCTGNMKKALDTLRRVMAADWEAAYIEIEDILLSKNRLLEMYGISRTDIEVLMDSM